MDRIRALIVLALTLNDSDPIKSSIEDELIRLEGFARYDCCLEQGEMRERQDNSLVEIGFNEGGRTANQSFADGLCMGTVVL